MIPADDPAHCTLNADPPASSARFPRPCARRGQAPGHSTRPARRRGSRRGSARRRRGKAGPRGHSAPPANPYSIPYMGVRFSGEQSQMCGKACLNFAAAGRTQAERGNTVTLPWIIAGAAAGLIAGPRIRASVFSRSTESGQPARLACPACAQQILPDCRRWRALLPVTGRCPSCRARIGPPVPAAGRACHRARPGRRGRPRILSVGAGGTGLAGPALSPARVH